jgi:sugar (pentulose or hexulose) kinase
MIDVREAIKTGKTALGIEFGSTNIKGVLVDENGGVLGTGSFGWENSLIDGIWTYSQEEIVTGLRTCYENLCKDVEENYGIWPETYGALGISAMMHGYIALDKEGRMLAPFQTWRNSNTEQAADELTQLFDFNIPLRWTIAHLYQCMLDHEEHLKDVAFVTTLDSYVHYLLTGEKVTGVGDASGIFPIDSETRDYDQKMVDSFDALIEKDGYSWRLRDILPKVLVAGQKAGKLTESGAKLLDAAGKLKSGIPMAPPEGDAGTGMVATNSVAPRTGNVSAGTSTFAMLVCEKPLSKVYREIDMVTTPTGYPVAMSHANNGTSDLNAWVRLFGEFAELAGFPMDPGKLFSLLYKNSLKGDPDCGGLLSYGYYSGEGITHLNEGRPLFVRQPDSNFNLANFMRAHLYSSLGAVKLGLDILLKDEHMAVDRIMGHGGLFKTKGVAQRYLAAAVHAPVSVLETAGEGGPWGMAILALYVIEKKKSETLEHFLNERIFADMESETVEPEAADIDGFEKFTSRYSKNIKIMQTAVKTLKG